MKKYLVVYAYNYKLSIHSKIVEAKSKIEAYNKVKYGENEIIHIEEMDEE